MTMCGWISRHTKSSSCYSLVHILSTSSWKSGPNVTVRFFCEIELSLFTILCTICRPHRPRVAWTHHFSTIFIWNRALATVSCTFYRPLSRIEARSSSDRGRPLYQKKHRASRPRVFSSVKSHVAHRSQFPTTWWWCGWHDDEVDNDDWDDDVVAMMLRQLAMTILRNSEAS